MSVFGKNIVKNGKKIDCVYLGLRSAHAEKTNFCMQSFFEKRLFKESKKFLMLRKRKLTKKIVCLNKENLEAQLKLKSYVPDIE